MLYEAHITVVEQSEHTRTGFSILAKSLGWKPIVIELSRGEHRIQVMAGHKFEAKSGIAAAFYAGQLDAMLARQGTKVSRIKVECPIDSWTEPAEYYEVHHKLLPLEDAPEFESWLRVHGMHLSFNREQDVWYVTERNYSSHSSALQQFIENRNLLGRNTPLIKTHMEAVIIDSNPQIDAGWF